MSSWLACDYGESAPLQLLDLIIYEQPFFYYVYPPYFPSVGDNLVIFETKK